MLATGEKIVFCYCDLDHLKYVNDHFGHGQNILSWIERHTSVENDKRMKGNI